VPSRKAREVKQALRTKGFHEEDRDHWYYIFYYHGKKSNIYTKISHNETDISPSLCAAMARQIKLNSSQFSEFVDCALTAEKYLNFLITEQYLPAPEKKADETERKPRG
jgi:hypothetical protein